MIGMKIKNYLFVAAMTATLVACGGKSGGLSTDDKYPVMTVGTSSATMQTTYPATIKGIQDVEIRPKISGFITKVCVHEGETVGAGQLLFVIDNETYQAAVREAQAAVGQARASINTARSQVNTSRLTYLNNKKLFDKKVIGQYELSTSLDNYKSAQANVAQAHAALASAVAALASARETLDFCYVKSPSAGVVGSLPYKVGALVSASSADALTTVSNISTMEVFFSMSEGDILSLAKTSGNIQAALKSFPVVKLQLADGSIYSLPGRVVKASGVINATTGSVSLIAHFTNPQRLLKSGGSGAIIVPKNNNDAIVIPQSACSQVQDKIFVYIVNSNNKVKYSEITVDPQDDGSNYIVTSGLHTGDRIVTKGLTTLEDGMKITPITEAQYAQNIDKAAKLGAEQGSAKGFIKAMTSK
jgi:membrane fusion protein (multidrug efflux system)